MNRREMADAMARTLGTKSYQAYDFIALVTDTIAEALADGGRVTLSGFGTLLVKPRQAKRVLSPADGKPMRIAPGQVVRFIPSRTLRSEVDARGMD
ncbi:MAG TPA: HU family DNA-binding protein [Candidatus Aminicenantes bacterium]|nr:HU family DNA-binding protein [Candidatus Aminicenantes bacterium]